MFGDSSSSAAWDEGTIRAIMTMSAIMIQLFVEEEEHPQGWMLLLTPRRVVGNVDGSTSSSSSLAGCIGLEDMSPNSISCCVSSNSIE